MGYWDPQDGPEPCQIAFLFDNPHKFVWDTATTFKEPYELDLHGHGYEVIETKSLTNPKDKISTARCFLLSPNGKKTYIDAFIPMQNVLGIHVRRWVTDF